MKKRVLLSIVFVVVIAAGAFCYRYQSSFGHASGLVNVTGDASQVVLPVQTVMNGPTPEMISQEQIRVAAEDQAAIEEANRAAEAQALADQAKAAEDEKIAKAASAAKAAALAIKLPQTGYCYRWPVYIKKYLNNDPLPDAKNIDGNIVCDVLKNGHKDHPSISSKNPKGHNGGACLDYDEDPSILPCYPVWMYGKMLDNFLDNNTPELIKAHGGNLRFKK